MPARDAGGFIVLPQKGLTLLLVLGNRLKAGTLLMAENNIWRPRWSCGWDLFMFGSYSVGRLVELSQHCVNYGLVVKLIIRRC